MTKRFTALALSAMMTVPIFADPADPFQYQVTAPGPEETSFTEIKVQFPDASEIEWIPGFFDRVNYYEITRDGEKLVYEFPQVYPDGNTLVFDIGSDTSSDSRVELTMQPGFFRLLDSAEAEIGVNPLLHIVVSEGKAQSTLDYTFTSEPADPDGKLLLTSLAEARLTFPAIETVWADAGMETGKSTFYAELEQPVYNGEYTVTIDKEAFGDTRWLSDPSMGRTNGPITLVFTLVDGEDRKAEPHIDLSLVKVTTEIAAVKGVPSEDDIYWYSNVTEKANYPGPQIWELLVDNFFKAGAFVLSCQSRMDKAI